MQSTIDGISRAMGAIGAFLFFVIGLMISYEVIARYVFLSPTSWAEEGARLLQLWATYLVMGYVLQQKALIRITVVTQLLSSTGQRILEFFALAWMLIFCGFAIYYGAAIVIESIQIGRATATMNQVPKFWTESAIPIGFFLFSLQILVEMWRVVRGETYSGLSDQGSTHPGGESV